MLKWFRSDPIRKLEARHAKTLAAATEAQRSGKIPRYAELTAEADAIAKEIDRLQASPDAG